MNTSTGFRCKARRVEAVFANGVLRLLKPPGLAEHQTVQRIVETDAAPPAFAAPHWHWRESQAIEDGCPGAVADEVARQRREG